VTLSGGEPLLQAEGCTELLRECRKMHIRTAVDTAGHVPWSALEAAIPLTDVFLFDVKTADESRHEAACGVSNRLILDNLKKLAEAKARIILRIPVVPQFNDRDEDIETFGDAIRGLRGIEKIELIPYHGLGHHKYTALGRTGMLQSLPDMTGDVADRLEASLMKKIRMKDRRP
jgi:pyruvate formate lyase activating enzyme